MGIPCLLRHCIKNQSTCGERINLNGLSIAVDMDAFCATCCKWAADCGESYFPEWSLLGSDVDLLHLIVKDFVSKLISCGIELIFVCDPPSNVFNATKSKLNCHLNRGSYKRQSRDVVESHAFNWDSKHQRSFYCADKLASKSFRQACFCMPIEELQINRCLQELKVKVIVANRDGDEELLNLIHKNSVSCIMSNDSDFLVMKGSRLIPFDSIKLSSTKSGLQAIGMLFTPEKLACNLGINIDRLVELPFLCGNDRYEDLLSLCEFREKLHLPLQRLQPLEAAEWLKSYLSEESLLECKVIKNIRHVNKEFAKVMDEIYSFYGYLETPKDYEKSYGKECHLICNQMIENCLPRFAMSLLLSHRFRLRRQPEGGPLSSHRLAHLEEIQDDDDTGEIFVLEESFPTIDNLQKEFRGLYYFALNLDQEKIIEILRSKDPLERRRIVHVETLFKQLGMDTEWRKQVRSLPSKDLMFQNLIERACKTSLSLDSRTDPCEIVLISALGSLLSGFYSFRDRKCNGTLSSKNLAGIGRLDVDILLLSSLLHPFTRDLRMQMIKSDKITKATIKSLIPMNSVDLHMMILTTWFVAYIVGILHLRGLLGMKDSVVEPRELFSSTTFSIVVFAMHKTVRGDLKVKKDGLSVKHVNDIFNSCSLTKKQSKKLLQKFLALKKCLISCRFTDESFLGTGQQQHLSTISQTIDKVSPPKIISSSISLIPKQCLGLKSQITSETLKAKSKINKCDANQGIITSNLKTIISPSGLISKREISSEVKIESPKPLAELPVFKHTSEILQAIKLHSIITIEGETGCGKSTGIPQILLDDCLLNNKKANIFVTQPRRVAALTLAAQVARLRNEPLGRSVGFKIGQLKCSSRATKITYVTVGYLLEVLSNQQDFLQDISHLILDEAHERSMDMDLLMLITKLLRNKYSVKLIIMSATMQSKVFLDYYSADKTNSPIHVGSSMHAVRSLFLLQLKKECPKLTTKLLQLEKLFLSPNIMDNIPPNLVILQMDIAIDLIRHILNIPVINNDKSIFPCILVFLPGIGEISKMYEILENKFLSVVVYILHSDLDTEDQEKAFRKEEGIMGKIVLSTNIAESSVTLPDTTHVINLGLERRVSRLENTSAEILELKFVSRSSVIQRTGRAGRVMPGTAFNLFSKSFFRSQMKEYTDPEICRRPLERVLLTLKASMMFFGQPSKLLENALSSPDISNIKQAYESLHTMGILTSSEEDNCSLSSFGRLANSFPVDISLTHWITYGIKFSCLSDCIVILAALSSPSLFIKPTKFFIKNPIEYNCKMAENFRSRIKMDGGEWSDPLSVWRYLKSLKSSRSPFRLEKQISYRRFDQLKYLMMDLCKRTLKLYETVPDYRILISSKEASKVQFLLEFLIGTRRSCASVMRQDESLLRLLLIYHHSSNLFVAKVPNVSKESHTIVRLQPSKTDAFNAYLKSSKVRDNETESVPLDINSKLKDLNKEVVNLDAAVVEPKYSNNTLQGTTLLTKKQRKALAKAEKKSIRKKRIKAKAKRKEDSKKIKEDIKDINVLKDQLEKIKISVKRKKTNSVSDMTTTDTVNQSELVTNVQQENLKLLCNQLIKITGDNSLDLQLASSNLMFCRRLDEDKDSMETKAKNKKINDLQQQKPSISLFNNTFSTLYFIRDSQFPIDLSDKDDIKSSCRFTVSGHAPLKWKAVGSSITVYPENRSLFDLPMYGINDIEEVYAVASEVIYTGIGTNMRASRWTMIPPDQAYVMIFFLLKATKEETVWLYVNIESTKIIGVKISTFQMLLSKNRWIPYERLNLVNGLRLVFSALSIGSLNQKALEIPSVDALFSTWSREKEKEEKEDKHTSPDDDKFTWKKLTFLSNENNQQSRYPLYDCPNANFSF